MREIKFKALDNKNKKWLSDYSISSYSEVLDLCKELNCEEENIILVQYTGLKDKNGVDIYEGDIVVYAEWKDMVCWNDKRAGFELRATKDNIIDSDDLSFSSKHIEKIGNIYENPELISEKNK